MSASERSLNSATASGVAKTVKLPVDIVVHFHFVDSTDDSVESVLVLGPLTGAIVPAEVPTLVPSGHWCARNVRLECKLALVRNLCSEEKGVEPVKARSSPWMASMT